MKIRAAVLEAMGATKPYAQSKPLKIDEVELRVERDGSQQTLTATLGTRPSSDNG